MVVILPGFLQLPIDRLYLAFNRVSLAVIAKGNDKFVPKGAPAFCFGFWTTGGFLNAATNSLKSVTRLILTINK